MVIQKVIWYENKRSIVCQAWSLKSSCHFYQMIHPFSSWTFKRNRYVLWSPKLVVFTWGQPIKLIQVVSTSVFHEYWWKNLDSKFLSQKKLSFWSIETSEALQNSKGTRKLKSWNSVVETTWISLIGWN